MSFFSKFFGFPSWSHSGVEMIDTSQEPTANQMGDLESQLIEESTTPRSFWSRLFGCFAPRMKKERSHPASCHDQTDYYQSAYQIRNSQIPTANGTELATTANGESKIASQERISFEPAPSGASTVHETDSNITKVDSSIAMDNYVFTASVDSYETATVEKTSDGKQRDIISPPKVHMVTSSKDIEFLVFPEADRIREPAITHNVLMTIGQTFCPVA